MTRIFGLNVLPEMLGLWLLETSICFLAFCLVLHDVPLSPMPDGLAARTPELLPVKALLLALTISLVGYAIGMYRPETCLEIRRLLVKAVVTGIISLPMAWLVAEAAQIDLASWIGLWSLNVTVAWVLLLFITRFTYMRAVQMNLGVRRVAILGAPQAAARVVDVIAGMRRTLFRVEVVRSSAVSDLPPGLWGVVFAGQDKAPALPPGVRGFDEETFSEEQLGRIDISALARRDGTGASFARSQRGTGRAERAEEMARRVLDVLLASALLLLTAPLLLLTAILIRLESPGPVIYRQERVGLGGRCFTLWKFRSMRTDAERLGPVWASVHDSRVTLVGRLIRKVRIDELPQLANILRGEMSLVGPRPERPCFVERLAEAIPLYRERARVKPGLTGWAQVNYPYGASVEDAHAKLSYDLYYVKHRSLLFDLTILLATVRVVLFQEGSR